MEKWKETKGREGRQIGKKKNEERRRKRGRKERKSN